MGKGDVKSRKGKLTKGSFGVRRPHKPKKTEGAKNTATPEKKITKKPALTRQVF